MVNVQGLPFLHWQLRYLRHQKIDKIIMAVSHQPDIIINYFGDRFLSMPIRYSKENKPLGTGGAIALALDQCEESSALIINGDTYFPVDLFEMAETHRKRKNDITIALKLMKEFDRYGSIEINAKNEITNFYEKAWKAKGYINGGIYLVNKSAFNNYARFEPFSIEKNVFEKNLANLQIGGFKSKAGFIDIGIPEEYNRIQAMKLR